jgi:hypothetical protein
VGFLSFSSGLLGVYSRAVVFLDSGVVCVYMYNEEWKEKGELRDQGST